MYIHQTTNNIIQLFFN